MKYEEVIDMLGYEAKDIITNQTGVITSVCFDLYGCIQVLMSPTDVENGTKYTMIGWSDTNRIKINKKKKRVMEPPDYKVKYSKAKDANGACMNKPIM